MTKIRWQGPANGKLLVENSACVSIADLDDLAGTLKKEVDNFSSVDLRILGSCAFFLALREASGNDPLLPAADRVIGNASISWSEDVRRTSFDSGCEEFRESIFSIRGLPPNEIIEHAHRQLLEILAELAPTKT